jgi:hypothetical protein
MDFIFKVYPPTGPPERLGPGMGSTVAWARKILTQVIPTFHRARRMVNALFTLIGVRRAACRKIATV